MRDRVIQQNDRRSPIRLMCRVMAVSPHFPEEHLLDTRPRRKPIPPAGGVGGGALDSEHPGPVELAAPVLSQLQNGKTIHR